MAKATKGIKKKIGRRTYGLKRTMLSVTKKVGNLNYKVKLYPVEKVLC